MDDLNKKLILDSLFKSAMASKERLNETNLYFGMALAHIKQIREEEEFDEEDFDSYKSMLAELQTNERRTLDKVENWKYINELGIDETDWKFLDSSIIRLCRKHQANPEKYMYMSYSDAVKDLENKEEA